jgi:Concanavalin A-like lectin/glucanases superfamily
MRIWDKSKPPLGAFTLNRDSPQAIGLAFWWPMGGSARYQPDKLKESGAFDLTPSGTPIQTLGIHGQPTIVLDGSSSYYTAPHDISINPTVLSVMCNVRFSTLTNAYSCLLSKFDGGTGFYWQFFVKSNGMLAVYANDGVTASYDGTGSYALAAGTAAHVAFTLSSNGLAGYVNGLVDISTSGWAGSVASNTGSISIGTDLNTAGRLVNGSIDDVRIYYKELSPAQLKVINDPGRKFELWYPLRSRKWIAIPAAAGFKPGWARGSNQITGGGAYVS